MMMMMMNKLKKIWWNRYQRRKEKEVSETGKRKEGRIEGEDWGGENVGKERKVDIRKAVRTATNLRVGNGKGSKYDKAGKLSMSFLDSWGSASEKTSAARPGYITFDYFIVTSESADFHTPHRTAIAYLAVAADLLLPSPHFFFPAQRIRWKKKIRCCAINNFLSLSLFTLYRIYFLLIWLAYACVLFLAGGGFSPVWLE